MIKAIALLLLLSSCATHRVALESTSSSEYQNAKAKQKAITYRIFPGDCSISKSSFEFKEYATYLERVLAKKGYKRVQKKLPNMIIFMKYSLIKKDFSFLGSSSSMYGRIITLAGYKAKKEILMKRPTEKPLWDIWIMNAGEEALLKPFVPAMFAAAIDYVGESTSKRIFVNIRKSDPLINEIKTGKKAK